MRLQYLEIWSARRPRNRWRSHAHLLFGNWINGVYQATPYDLGVGRGSPRHPGAAGFVAGLIPPYVAVLIARREVYQG